MEFLKAAFGITRYAPGPDNLGVGTGNQAFLRTQTRPRQDGTHGGLLIQRTLESMGPPQLWANPTTTAVSLRGNGVYLAAMQTAQSLTNYKGPKKGDAS